MRAFARSRRDSRSRERLHDVIASRPSFLGLVIDRAVLATARRRLHRRGPGQRNSSRLFKEVFQEFDIGINGVARSNFSAILLDNYIHFSTKKNL